MTTPPRFVRHEGWTPAIGTRVTVEGRTWVYVAAPMWGIWRCQTTGKDALYDHHCALTRVAELQADLKVGAETCAGGDAVTEPNDLPPVGATVTDANGNMYRVGLTAIGGPRWTDRLVTRQWVGVGSDMNATLTALWRLQQERDELKAESRVIMQTYAIESDRSLAECVTRSVDGWRERCETAEARVAELERSSRTPSCPTATPGTRVPTFCPMSDGPGPGTWSTSNAGQVG